MEVKENLAHQPDWRKRSRPWNLNQTNPTRFVRKLNARIDSNPFRNACRNTQTQIQIHMAFDFGFNRNLTGIPLEWFLRIFEIHLARFHIVLERSRPAHVNYFMFYLLLANSNCCWMRIQQRRALMITNHWNVTIQLGLSFSCSDLYRCEIYCARALFLHESGSFILREWTTVFAKCELRSIQIANRNNNVAVCWHTYRLQIHQHENASANAHFAHSTL